jgi:hypothetical protein
MKKFKTMAVAAVGVALASQVAHATPNDLLLGLTETGDQDYAINLGQASALVGSPTVVNLTSDFSTSQFGTAFAGGAAYGSTAFANGANGVSMAVAGGMSVGATGNSIFVTQLRTVNNPASQPGSALQGTQTQPTVAPSSGFPNDVINEASLTSGTGTLLTASGADSFSTQIYTGTPNNFVQSLGVNPGSTITGDIIKEDLYTAVDAFVGSGRTKISVGTYQYLGYFTLDLSGDTAQLLTFTSANLATPVPEPATYGVLAGAGLLILSLGNQLRRKSA